VETGRTRVICTASVEDRVPPFMRNSGKGWVTAEYGMLPRATTTRVQRESTAGKVGGRTQEIQRLIGRSLRSVVDMPRLGERTIWIDCDVIQADGGTRTASITGGFVALVLAFEKLRQQAAISRLPILSDGTLGPSEVFATGLVAPDGIAFDRAGNLLVVGGDTLSVVDRFGAVSTLSTSPLLEWPSNLAFGRGRGFARRDAFLVNYGLPLGSGTQVLRVQYNHAGARLVR
jgi:hypothetical protein